MAESLGRATFDILLDTSAFKAGIEQVRTLAGRAGQQIEKALGVQAQKGTLAALDVRITALQKEIRLVEIGSQKYKELQAAIRKASNERAQAEGSGGFGGLGALAGQLGLAAAAATAAAAAFRQLKEIDAANAAVRTLGVNSEQLAKELNRVTRAINGNVSRVELTKAAYDVASAGFNNASDAAKILEASANGAVGGFSNLNTVGDAATSVLNAYGLSADNAAKIVDGFIQTQNDGKIIVSQYADQIGRVAPIAAAAGVGIDELNAAISAATAQGVPVESTFAGLRQAISSILKPTAEAQKLAQELGLDFNAQALQAKGLGGFLAEVAEKTGASAEKNSVLFGSVEALAAVQPLLNDGLVKYTRFLDNQAKSSGVAAKAAQENSNTISGGLTKIGNSLSDLATSTDRALGPLIGGFLQLAAAALRLEPAIAGVAAAAAVLGGPALLGAVKALVISTIAWARSIAAAAAAQATLIGLTPGGLVLIAAAVGAGTAAYVALTQTIDNATGAAQANGVAQVDAAGKAKKQLDAQAIVQQQILSGRLQELSASQKNLQAQERRLDLYKQETDLVNQINQVRNNAAIGRSELITSLLDQELRQAQALASTDQQRRNLELAYGQAKFNQTVKEFELKARALVAEQAGQRASLSFEQQKVDAANRRAVIEAQIALLKARQAYLDKPSEAAATELRLARERVDLIVKQQGEERRLGDLRSDLLGEQQAAAREQLASQRLIALNGQAQYGTLEQQYQLQQDVNRELVNQSGYADAAAVSAGNFKAQLEGAATARGQLSTAFQAQVNTVLDGTQQFTTMNNYLSTIATNTANPPQVTVNVEGGCGGGSYTSVNAPKRA